MSESPYESWPLDERTAKVLGLPLIALSRWPRWRSGGEERDSMDFPPRR